MTGIEEQFNGKKLLVKKLIPFGFPKELPGLLKKPGYLPAYHMNKKSWVTVILDGTVPLSEIKKLLDKSYTLA